jgi:hypothetical protein
MDEYVFQGKLYVPKISRLYDFGGSFLRVKGGTLECRMEFNELRLCDARHTNYGSITNEATLGLPYDGAPQNHLILLHVADNNSSAVDVVYWLSDIATNGESFDGVYEGFRERLVHPLKV